MRPNKRNHLIFRKIAQKQIKPLSLWYLLQRISSLRIQNPSNISLIWPRWTYIFCIHLRLERTTNNLVHLQQSPGNELGNIIATKSFGFNPVEADVPYSSHTPLAPHRSQGILRMVYVASPANCCCLGAIWLMDSKRARWGWNRIPWENWQRFNLKMEGWSDYSNHVFLKHHVPWHFCTGMLAQCECYTSIALAREERLGKMFVDCLHLRLEGIF